MSRERFDHDVRVRDLLGGVAEVGVTWIREGRDTFFRPTGR